MGKKIWLLWVFQMLMVFSQTQASHIVGGGFNVQYLGANQYRIQLDYYKDCGPNSIEFPPGALKIGMFKIGNNDLDTTFQLAIDTTYIVDFSNVNCISSPINCVQKREYVATVVLDSSMFTNPSGYYLSYEQCCRNSLALNVNDPQNLGIVFYLEMPALSQASILMVNSSPVFQNYPSANLCASELYNLDFSAIDIDGDSLVYSVVEPLKGHTDQANLTNQTGQNVPLAQPYAPIDWANGYGPNFSNIMDGNPDLKIDSSTGELTVRPNQIGVYVAAIKCEEYRNGVKLGEIRRELQFAVVNCPIRFSPKLNAISDISNLNFVPNEKLCFQIEATDSNLTDTLQIFIDSIDPGFNYGTITFTSVKGLSPRLAEFCFTASCDIIQSDSLNISFMVGDASCPLPLKANLFVNASLTVPEKFNFKEKLPNVFTPNSDGINDFFQLPTSFPKNCGNDFELKIFSRWGKLIYQSKDLNFKWDGEKVPEGVYFISLKVNAQTYNATLSLLR